MVKATADTFTDAIPQQVSDTLKEYLDQDAFVFSALKTHTQLTQARSFLKTENGDITPYHEFRLKVLKLNKAYNHNYLEAEYEFAVQSAQSADAWDNLQDDTNRYWLQYRTAGDSHVRASHQPLHDTTLPKDDPFWDEYYPPNGWRCRCVAIEVMAQDQTKSDTKQAIEKGEKATTQIGKSGKNKLEMFRFNPGKHKKLFPPKNTYTKVVGADMVKKQAKEQMLTKADKEILLQNNPYIEALEDYKKLPARMRFAKGVPEEQGAAIRLYTQSNKVYTHINIYKRTGKIDPYNLFDLNSKNLKVITKAINAGLNKLPDYKGTVYRGTTLPKAVFAKYKRALKQNKPITDKGFLSSSMVEKKAFEGGHQFTIVSKTGKNISKGSSIPREKEVLFRSGTKFKVIKIEKRDDIQDIYLEEL